MKHTLIRAAVLATASAGTVLVLPGVGNAIPTEDVHIGMSVDSNYNLTVTAASSDSSETFDFAAARVSVVGVGEGTTINLTDAADLFPSASAPSNSYYLPDATAGDKGTPAVFIAYVRGGGHVLPDTVFDGYFAALVCTSAKPGGPLNQGNCEVSPTMVSLPDIERWVAAQ